MRLTYRVLDPVLITAVSPKIGVGVIVGVGVVVAVGVFVGVADGVRVGVAVSVGSGVLVAVGASSDPKASVSAVAVCAEEGEPAKAPVTGSRGSSLAAGSLVSTGSFSSVPSAAAPGVAEAIGAMAPDSFVSRTAVAAATSAAGDCVVPRGTPAMKKPNARSSRASA